MTRYVALLRGINVGGHRKVEMTRLKELFVATGYHEVVTYLNTGNVLFESDKALEMLEHEIPVQLTKEFGLDIPTLVLPHAQVQRIAAAIPDTWLNNKETKTDIAFLFPEIDQPNIVEQLPVKHEYMSIKYVPGAIIWHLERTLYNKSQLNKIVASKLYQQMTVRNVNTTRYLANTIT